MEHSNRIFRTHNPHRSNLTAIAMTILTPLDYIVITLILAIPILLIHAITRYRKIANDTESPEWDLPPLDLDTHDTKGREHREAVLRRDATAQKISPSEC
jgi:hypothetical protein